jgi:putative transcriptional regulator
MIRVTIERCLLSDILIRKDKTAAQLSDMTGINETQLSKYKNNRETMSYKNAKLIAIALGCSMDDLYEYRISK